jgi:hypothetical protein
VSYERRSVGVAGSRRTVQTAIVSTEPDRQPLGRGHRHGHAAETSAGNDRSSSGPVQTDKAVDVALAEFHALRTETIHHMAARATLVGVGLTAVGVLFGFAIRQGGDRELLLAVPLLAALVSLLHAGRAFRVTAIGDYIRTVLWPYLQRRVDHGLPSWETYFVTNRGKWWSLQLAIWVDAPVTVIFAAASVTALLLAPKDADSILWNVGWVFTGLVICAPFCVLLLIQARRSED